MSEKTDKTDPAKPDDGAADVKARGARKFTTRSTVVVDGEIHPPGATISLTQEAHAGLAALGAIEGEWK